MAERVMPQVNTAIAVPTPQLQMEG
jgi:hypothetical protein